MSSVLRSKGALLLALALPAVGAVEFALQLFFEPRAPAADEYGALLPAIEALHHEGDLVVVNPPWAEPHVRRALGDRYFPLNVVARADEQRFERAIEVRLPSAGRSALIQYVERSRKSVGEFEVAVLENPQAQRPLFDFVANLDEAHATVFGTEPLAACRYNYRAKVVTGGLFGFPTFPAQRFECERGDLNVSRTVAADQDYRPRVCIYAHPPATGSRTIRFAKVPIGQRLRGHAMLHWMHEREATGSDVHLEVRVGGASLGEVTHVDGQGWLGFSFPTEQLAGSEAEVEFVVSGDGNSPRPFCFEAISE